MPALLGKFASNDKGGGDTAAAAVGTAASRAKPAVKATILDDRTIQNISIAVKGAVRRLCFGSGGGVADLT